MEISDEEKLEVLLKKLKKFNYDIDVAERNHLLSLIRRGYITIDLPKEYLDPPEVY